MRAMVLSEYNAPLVLRDLPVPILAAGEVLLRVLACGSGLTLHHAVTGNAPARLPIILGHEVVGEVIECGSDAEGVVVGDKVTVHGLLFCGHCRMCLTGREPLCETMRGMIGRQTDGGYAEFMSVPDRNCIALPPGLLARHSAAEACVIADAWRITL